MQIIPLPLCKGRYLLDLPLLKAVLVLTLPSWLFTNLAGQFITLYIWLKSPFESICYSGKESGI